MRMSQALGNVVRNAIHCTEAGGNTVIGAEMESGKALAISITDGGIGISTADLPHVFDRSCRTGPGSQPRDRRHRLGLAITRTIVEAHGGTIAVASDGLGQGATVTINLPLTKRIQLP